MLIDECEIMREQIAKTIFYIENRIREKLSVDVGIEKQVFNDIDNVCNDYLFIVFGVLYRWDNCINYLKQILGNIDRFYSNICEGDTLGCDMNCNLLSYEFENLLVSFARLNEAPLIEEISRHISRKNEKKLRDNCYKKNDNEGLYWEINLLRNRAAHSTPGYYTVHKERAARYMSISSRIRGIIIKDGCRIFHTNLISYRYNEYIKKVVKDYIVDSKHGDDMAKTPLMDLLFESTKPTGRGKNNPQLLYISNLTWFDLNSEFLELSKDILGYIQVQLNIILEEVSQ